MMQRMIVGFAGLTLLVAACLFCSPAFAGPVITVDENGNGIGTVGPGFVGNDPAGGGLMGVLIYNLPFAGVQGDVFLTEGTNLNADTLRFNGNGTLIFYSDTSTADPKDSLADTALPGGFYNHATLTEVGDEGNNGAFYTPLAGQSGYDPSGPTYHFISDGTAVPEPASLTMLGIGAAALLGYGWRRRTSGAA